MKNISSVSSVVYTSSLPRAPEALVDRTIRRMTAIDKGRLAEQELARIEDELKRKLLDMQG